MKGSGPLNKDLKETISKVLKRIQENIGEHANLDLSKANKGLRLVVDTNQYSIYECIYISHKVIAAFGDMKVVQKFLNKDKLIFFPYCSQSLIHYTIVLTEKKFPGLLPESHILSCQLIPYMREIEKNKFERSIRLIIITNKGQIYHNYIITILRAIQNLMVQL